MDPYVNYGGAVTRKPPGYAGAKDPSGGTIVAASQTNANIGEGFLDYITIVPETVDAGAVSIKPGSSGTARTLFTGGAAALGALNSFTIGVGDFSDVNGGGWLVTTGANVHIEYSGNLKT